MSDEQTGLDGARAALRLCRGVEEIRAAVGRGAAAQARGADAAGAGDGAARDSPPGSPRGSMHRFRDALDFGHEPEGVSAVDLADLGGRVSLFQQGAREVGPLVDAVEALGRAAYAIEVTAEADGIHARDFDHVVDVLHDVAEGSAE